MSHVLQGADYSQFMAWGNACEYDLTLQRLLQRLIIHGIQVRTIDNARPTFPNDANTPRYAFRRQSIVASYHYNADASTVTFLHRHLYLHPWWVHHSSQPQKSQVTLNSLGGIFSHWLCLCSHLRQ